MGIPVFRFEIVNAKETEIFFDGLLRALKDWRQSIWPALARRAIKPMIRRSFESEGAENEHGQWAALSPDYGKRKERLYGDLPILVGTPRARMKRTMLASYYRGEQQALSMTWSAPKPAIYHQAGTVKMPSRRIIDPNRRFFRDARASVAEGLLTAMRRIGYARGWHGMTPGEAHAVGYQVLKDRLKGI